MQAGVGSNSTRQVIHVDMGQASTTITITFIWNATLAATAVTDFMPSTVQGSDGALVPGITNIH